MHKLVLRLRRRKIPFVTLSREDVFQLSSPDDIEDFKARLQDKFRNSLFFIANCAGVNRRLQYSSDSLAETLSANFSFAIILLRLSERLGCGSFHLSTGDLDAGADLSNERMALKRFQELPRHQFFSAESARKVLNEHAEDGCAEFDHYLVSKMLMERACLNYPDASFVRVSNFFGAEVSRRGLIPRLIETRLRGHVLRIPNDDRNWSCVDELGSFLSFLCSEQADHSSKCIWAYGSYDKSAKRIFELICEHLPTCYGSVEFISSLGSKVPEVPRIWEQSDLARLPTIFSTKLRNVVRQIRRNVEYSNADCSLSASEVKRARMSGIAGGSIAEKTISSKQTLVKRASQDGYEGAGFSKIKAEIRFYDSLKNGALDSLFPLYPKMISSSVTGSTASIELEYIGKGRSVSDCWAENGEIPVQQVLETTHSLFQGSYLNTLRAISDEKSQQILDSLYLDRPIDRLENFTEIASRLAVDKKIAGLIHRIKTGEDLTINGQSVMNPLTLLRRIQSDDEMREAFRPRSVGLCGHGDLTILNMIFDECGDRAVLGNGTPPTIWVKCCSL